MSVHSDHATALYSRRLPVANCDADADPPIIEANANGSAADTGLDKAQQALGKLLLIRGAEKSRSEEN